MSYHDISTFPQTAALNGDVVCLLREAIENTLARKKPMPAPTLQKLDQVTQPIFAWSRSVFMPAQLMRVHSSGVPPPFQCVSRLTASE
jgi:hypothetical protein